MDVFLTLDYELFLGTRSGSVRNCLIEPMTMLDDIAMELDIRYTIFVDATYLIRLQELMKEHPVLRQQYQEVTEHLRALSKHGHDLQLHLHPQWAFSDFDGKEWQIDSVHYKLSDISDELAADLFRKGSLIIKEISGKFPIAFRAGGFSAQPADMTAGLMHLNNIKIDSSVYPGTIYDTLQQQYDYRNAPEGYIYNFETDFCVEDNQGSLKELPLSTYNVSPLFFWKLVFQRITRQRKHLRFGDGRSVKTAGASIVKRLTSYAKIHATIDESKISFLYSAYKSAKKQGHTTFCVIGHPKLTTSYSIKKLPEVLAKMKRKGAIFKTVSQIVD